MANFGQTEKNQLAAPKMSLQQMLSDNKVKGRFEQILKDNAPGFISSIITTVNGNKKLREIADANPQSVIRAAAIAAALKLPIDPNLGFSCIVPYGKEVQFQMEWKGFVQLALRTGQYQNMNVSEVYEDEIKFFNPLTGEIEFTEPDTWKQRDEGKTDKVVGYYFWFKLTNGFSKGIYWTKTRCEKHAKQYSKAYNYDLSNGKKESIWSKNFDAAGMKTVVKQGLSKW
jgi:recombination protein RecT